MFTIHATRKLLDRVGCRLDSSIAASSTMLGGWYATALFWKPQVVMLVNGQRSQSNTSASESSEGVRY